MRFFFLTICLCATFSCIYKDTSREDIDKKSRFSLFLDDFDTLQLPLSIMKLNDFSRYSDSVWCSVDGKTRLIRNPVNKVIEKSDYYFIKDKHPISDHFQYSALYKAKVYDYFILIFKQSNYQIDEYWIKLSSYSNSGVLLDTLTIAGQKVNVFDKYCEIDTNFSISIRIFHELVSDAKDDDLLNAMETFERYTITREGQIELHSRNSMIGYYRIEGNDIVRVK